MGVDRDGIFLTTKVWCSNLRYDDTLAVANDSLDALNTEYIDPL